MKLPLPRNSTEMALLTKWYFGKELHVRLFVTSSGGLYEVDEDYKSYHGPGWNFGTGDIDGYDYSRRFWKAVFGELQCGGIGRASYGSFKFTGHRHTKRLMRLMNTGDSKTIDPVRPVFVRLASQRRARREWKSTR